MAHAWYGDWLFWTLSGGGAALLVVTVGVMLWLRLTAVQRNARRTLRDIADRMLCDVVLPDGIGGFVPIDVVLLRGRRLYVLDVRDVEGAIFCSEKMDVWTAMGRKRRYQFKNPLRTMHDRLAAVKLAAPGLDVMARILFTSRGHFPKGRPDGVQLLEEFAQPLLRPSQKGPMAIESDLEAAWAALCRAADTSPIQERAQSIPRT